MTALTPLVAVAAVVLCVAGAAKLRSPRDAADALAVLGVPANALLIRAFAVGELALGALALLAPGRVVTGTIAGLYAAFATIGVALARRHASCGCFGEARAPATASQAILSAALALIALIATVSPAPAAAAWIGSHGAGVGVPLVIGTLGAAYASVIAYTRLPLAWGAWSGR